MLRFERAQLGFYAKKPGDKVVKMRRKFKQQRRFVLQAKRCRARLSQPISQRAVAGSQPKQKLRIHTRQPGTLIQLRKTDAEAKHHRK